MQLEDVVLELYLMRENKKRVDFQFFLLYNINVNKGGSNMKKIKFKYRDEISNWEWREQECVVSSVEECIKIYGLGIDCDYQILSVEDI